MTCDIHGPQNRYMVCRCVLSAAARIAYWLEANKHVDGQALCRQCGEIWDKMLADRATSEEVTRIYERLKVECSACIDYHIRPLLPPQLAAGNVSTNVAIL